ncbi:MAG: hypothetical protein K2O18_00935 [Oscillospiraceae bacterium]|nr:hypothetical protein [Oscillospiraceae bacterium]
MLRYFERRRKIRNECRWPPTRIIVSCEKWTNPVTGLGTFIIFKKIKSLGRKADSMNWKDYVKPIQASDIANGSLESIITNLFEIAGCEREFSSDAAKSWLYRKRNCKSNIYFPKGTIKTDAVFRYFRNRPDERLYTLQSKFEEQVLPDSDSPIDVKTKNLDIFCWSLVNQFLDLLRLERVDIPQPKGVAFHHVRKPPVPHDRKCCLYCVQWKGDRSAVGISTIPTDGICHTNYRANRCRLISRLSSTAACANYKADQKLLNRMKEYGYDVNDFL